jgi:hypothetical protein
MGVGRRRRVLFWFFGKFGFVFFGRPLGLLDELLLLDVPIL